MSRSPDAGDRSIRPDPLLALAALLGLGLVWAYWPTLFEMGRRWSTDPRYAHGYLVPVFSVVLLWLRRDRLRRATSHPSWWGLLLIAAGLALRLAGARFYLGWIEGVSLLPVLGGLALLVGGCSSLRGAWPAIAFLIFMVPLPFRIEGALSFPLQRVATKASTYALQTLGFPALAGGNIIYLDDVEISVVEACSGLSMLFTFIAIATGVAMVIRRPWLDKIMIVASALPIAVLVNVARITVTGVLHQLVGSRLANLVFHDLAGWLMMPMALGLLWLELVLLAHLLIEPVRPVIAFRPIDLTREPQAVRGIREGSRRGAQPEASAVPLKRASSGS